MCQSSVNIASMKQNKSDAVNCFPQLELMNQKFFPDSKILKLKSNYSGHEGESHPTHYNVKMCPYYASKCIKCDLKICILGVGSKLSGTADRQISMGGNGEGVYKHSAGDISRLAAWDHIVPAATTYPMTKVSYNTLFAMYKKD
jgi:hypothetical protein